MLSVTSVLGWLCVRLDLASRAKYQRLAHEQFFARREQTSKQSKKVRSKERNLSKETKRRQQ